MHKAGGRGYTGEGSGYSGVYSWEGSGVLWGPAYKGDGTGDRGSCVPGEVLWTRGGSWGGGG